MESWFPLLRLRPRLVDGLVAAWVVAWLVTGVIAVLEIRDLRSLSDTLAESGTAIDTAGSALETLGAVPIIGDGPERLGEQVRSTAAEVQVSALETKDSLENLSVALGLAIAFIPTVPLLSVYVPWRVTTGREREAIRQALEQADPEPDPALEEFLAHRAVQRLPFDTLTTVTSTPWRDLAEGKYRSLANAELARIGLDEAARAVAARSSRP